MRGTRWRATPAALLRDVRALEQVLQHVLGRKSGSMAQIDEEAIPFG